MKPTRARLTGAAAVVLAGLVALGTLVTWVAPAGSAARAATTQPAAAGRPASAAGKLAVGAGVPAGAHPVMIIGIPGLRWTDISRSATPALWRLAQGGSVGSLVVSAVQTFTCPADAWLTLNSGARAQAPRGGNDACKPLPPVSQAASVAGAAAAAPARVPALASPGGIEPYNRQFSYHPDWGLLNTIGGARGCAIGPGGALALAGRGGAVASYRPSPAAVAPGALRGCPLTVADLGALPADGGSGAAAAARADAVRVADRTAARLIAAAPPGAIVVVAGLGDSSAPHVRAIIVSGPGFGPGLLHAASARQPGMVLVTDLTPTVADWRGDRGAIPASAVGSQILSGHRGSLGSAIRTLAGQDTAAQVYRGTLAAFFLTFGFGEGVVFGLIALLLRGDRPERRRRRRAAYRVAAVIGGAIPAGTFLASLVPWPVLPHPALLLYGVGLAWAAVIAAIALAGPWRRDPLGPPGFLGAVTVGVIGVDVITGSHLQLGTPFGLSALAAGRFYGIGNNAVGVYALGGLLCAAWCGRAALRATGRRQAVAAAGAVAAFTVVAAGWPGFGAKVGGTIAMVPGFLVLLAALAGIRLNVRRGALVAVSGLVLIAIFAVISYNIPAAGTSDIGAFVGHVLHGGAGGILERKIHANVGSLSENWATPIIPLVVVGTGLMLAWPQRLRLRTVSAATADEPLLRPLLTAMWLVAVLGWLANDSGVTVTAAALPFALPLVIAIVTGFAGQEEAGKSDHSQSERSAPATHRAG